MLPPEFWLLEPGDIVSWTSARNGYATKLFRVDGIIDRANLDVMVDLTEIDPSDYDWNDSTDYRTPVDGPVMLVRPTPQPITAWNAEGVVDIIGGKQRACIKLSWDGDQPDVDRVQWEIRRVDTLEVVTADGTDSVERGAALISHNIFSLTAYGARGRYISLSGRPTLWSDWLPVMTPDAPYSDIIAYLANLQKEVRDYLQDRHREFDETFQRLEFLAANVGTSNAEDIVQRQHFIKQIGDVSAEVLKETALRVSADEAMASDMSLVQAKVGENAAAILQEATARTTADSALASDLTLVNVRVDNSNALIANEASARADGDSALATSLNAVSAKADAGTAQGLMQWSAIAAPAGISARFALVAKASAGDSFKFGGAWLDVYPGWARWTFLADQFVITDGSATGTPFVYEGSVLKLAGARIGWANIDDVNITSAQIGNLNVKTSNLDFSSVTSSNALSGSSTSIGTEGVWIDIATVVIDNPNPNTVFCEYAVALSGLTGNTIGILNARCRLINKTTGAVIGKDINLQMDRSVSFGQSQEGFFMDMSPATRGAYVYALQMYWARVTGSNTFTNISYSGSLKMLWWKR